LLTTRDVHYPTTGADNRAKYLFEGLAGEFETDLVCFDRREETSATRDTTVPYPRSELLAIVSVRFLWVVLERLFASEYDGIVVSGIGATTYGLLATLLQPTSAFVFDDHNVEHALAKRNGIGPRFVVVYALERASCALASLVVVPTSEVRETLRPWCVGAIEVVTNGFDEERFAPDGPAMSFDESTLLFFGNFEYEPNVEALDYIVTRLCDDLDEAGVDASVLLAGPGLDAACREYSLPDRVQRLGFVEDLPALIRGADLVVVPLETGSGSRLKIIEALACSTRVVSTPIGAEGWPADWENLVRTDLDQFSETTVETLDSGEFDHDEYEDILTYSWQSQAAEFVNYIRATV